MTIFQAYKDPQTGETTCLPDRFSWLAFLLPPVWAIAHGLWRELASILIGVILLALAAGYFELPFLALYLVGALFLGFEANALHGQALVRRGHHPLDPLSARDRIEAETKSAGRQFGQA